MSHAVWGRPGAGVLRPRPAGASAVQRRLRLDPPAAFRGREHPGLCSERVVRGRSSGQPSKYSHKALTQAGTARHSFETMPQGRSSAALPVRVCIVSSGPFIQAPFSGCCALSSLIRFIHAGLDDWLRFRDFLRLSSRSSLQEILPNHPGGSLFQGFDPRCCFKALSQGFDSLSSCWVLVHSVPSFNTIRR